MHARWEGEADDEPGVLVDFPAARVAALPGIAACPHLGLVDDRATHAMVETPDHRCFAHQQSEISLDHQRRFCLSANFETCPAALGARLPGPDRTNGATHRTRVWRTVAASGAIIAVLLLTFGVLTALSANMDEASPLPPQDPVAAPTATPGTSSTLAASPVQSSPSEEEAPLALGQDESGVAAAPTAIPDGMAEHVVAAGETEATIALLYQWSVDDLRLVNGLQEGDVLDAGMVLLVPLHGPTEPEAAADTEPLPTPVPEAPATSAPAVFSVPQVPVAEVRSSTAEPADAAPRAPIGSLTPPYEISPVPSQGAPGAAEPAWRDAVP